MKRYKSYGKDTAKGEGKKSNPKSWDGTTLKIMIDNLNWFCTKEEWKDRWAENSEKENKNWSVKMAALTKVKKHLSEERRTPSNVWCNKLIELTELFIRFQINLLPEYLWQEFN